MIAAGLGIVPGPAVKGYDKVIKAQQKYYEDNSQTNPAELTLEEAELLLLEEI